MFREKRLIVGMLVIIALCTACGKNNAGESGEQSGSDNAIVLSDDNKEEPNLEEEDDEDEDEDVLEKPAEELRIDVRAAVVGDCTGIGFAPIMGWGEKDKNHEKYTLNVASTAAAAADMLKNNEADVAIVPLDTAVRLYAEDQSVVVLATNTYNNIYIADVTGLRKTKGDLAGQAVYVADDGSLATSASKAVIQACGAQVQTMESNDAVVQALAAGTINLAAVPEPYITLAKMKNDAVEMGPDVAEIWKEDHASEIISSVLIARRDFVEANKDSMVYILDDFKQSVNTVIHGVTKTLEWSGTFNIVPDRSLAISTMKNCNYNYADGMEMRAAIESFVEDNLETLGTAPDENFYYTGNE